ncbi:MAG: branched chain amino acid--2-keto-4-methylthiobutyrate aminotransferase [Geothermobacteraceae bacterium]
MSQQGPGTAGGAAAVHILTAYRSRLHQGPLATPDQAALLYGDSLFETIRLDQGRLIWLDDHLDRIENHARLAGIPFDRRQALADLNLLAANSPWPVARVRLTAGSGRLDARLKPTEGLQFASAAPYAPPAADQYRQGVTCVIAQNRRINPVSHLPQMKRGNYADCLAARRQALQEGAFEALFVDAEGNLLEGSISNIFALIDDILLTPPTGNIILPGIARARVLRAAQTIGLRTLEHPLHRDLLPHLQGLQLSNSLFGLLPVRAINGTDLPVSGWSEKLLQALGEVFETLL